MGLGDIKNNETIRLTLWLPGTPDGLPATKPQVTIQSQSTVILSSTDMVQGATDQDWYYDYAVAANATPGAYQVRYDANVGGEALVGLEDFNVTGASLDDVKTDTAQIITDVAGVPTVGEIDTELTNQHGSGAWTASGAGSGAYVATINVTDGVPSDVADAYVTMHNAANDDSPVIASGTTDTSGNVVLNIDGNVYVRVKKTGFNFTATALNVTASGTYNVTGTALVITPPIDPAVSTCYISVYGLDGTVVTAAVALVITKHDDLTKDASGNFATSSGITMVYDVSSETWQADIIKDTHVKITSTKVMGVDDNGALINREFTVGSGSTTNLGSIRLA